MPSIGVPQIQRVYIFNGELEQLKRYQKDIKNGLIPYCYLYGLWTHSSNVVIHLVVSNPTEFDYVQSHQLDCVGYVAKTYSANLYDSIKRETKLSTKRQHIIVDTNETVKTGSLRACASQSGSHGQKQYLQVTVLSHESPFRSELWKRNPETRAVMNESKNESENDSEVYRVNHERPSERNESHQNGIKVYDRGSAVEANIHENSIRTSETDPYHGNQINGHQGKKNESSPFIKCLKHRIKRNFQAEIKIKPVDELPEKFSFGLCFQHDGKQWQIEIKENLASGKTFVKIFFSEQSKHEEELLEACSQEFDTTQTVIDKIQELCMCEKCNKIK